MTCCFSKQEVPTEKLLVLYYPPTMAHHAWSKSVYAAARAREALGAITGSLQTMYWRYVVGRRLLVGLGVGLVGLILVASWGYTLATSWADAGFPRRYLQLFAGLILLTFAHLRLRAFRRRAKLWNSGGNETVAGELRAIEEEIHKLPEDPTAEQAAAILRRKCPDIVSEIAFDGTYFRAFTYMDFVMYPQLKHPAALEELPRQHSLNRDAYYVGDVVYDNWRMFHKNQHELVDPRFVGSAGRRGVI
jgi:hypothetical protein